jgi:2-amino-4-hydroxy-6-hydroxymethyldihydropteridine diphosphokinase
MILVALGSNLPGPAGDPRAMVEAALAAMPDHGLRVVARSPWYRSAPVPPSDQPWFVNGVARVARSDDGPADPEALLAALHAIEHAFGRRRDGTPNAARGLDLDLLDVDGLKRDKAPVLPHPRMTGRAFVLRPLADLVPGWRDPLSGRTVEALLSDLGSGDLGLDRLEA